VVRKIRNSLKAGKSDSEIVRTLQGRGYRLEYIHLLLKKAKWRKVFFLFFSGFLLLFIAFLVFIGVIVYGVLFVNTGEKMDLKNPLGGVNVNFGERNGVVDVNYIKVNESFVEEVYIDDVEITVEFISYLLNELGAWQLRPNPITGEVPSIDFIIDDKRFNSVVGDGIVTTKGLGVDSDIVFYSKKKEIVRAMLSKTPAEVFRDSYNSGKSSLDVKKSEAELFMKGYFGLYDSLKS